MIILFPSSQRVSFVRVSYPPPQPMSLLGCAEESGIGTPPPQPNSAKEILYVPPLLIGIGTTNAPVSEDGPYVQPLRKC